MREKERQTDKDREAYIERKKEKQAETERDR